MNSQRVTINKNIDPHPYNLVGNVSAKHSPWRTSYPSQSAHIPFKGQKSISNLQGLPLWRVPIRRKLLGKRQAPRNRVASCLLGIEETPASTSEVFRASFAEN